MRIRRAKIIAVFLLALAALVVAFVFTSAPPVSLTIRGFAAKQWSDDIAQRMGNREYVVASIELTNASKRSITYWGRLPNFPAYARQYWTGTGWKEPPRGFVCGTPMERYSLAPSEAITFEAVVDKDKPCKVSLSYTDGRTPSRLWQRLPWWLTQRLPWTTGWSTVTTEAIDLRGAVGLTVKPHEPLFKPQEKPPEDIHAIKAAAENDDATAQFTLAGKYWIGTGVEKSVSEAMTWYEKAAQNGHAEAAYNLATIHEYGLAGIVDRKRAIELYRRAGEAGHAEAKARLRILAAK